MKKIPSYIFWLIVLILPAFLFMGYITVEGMTQARFTLSPTLSEEKTGSAITAEDSKRLSLYLAALGQVYRADSTTPAFIALQLDTLENLGDAAKKIALEKSEALCPNVYDYQSIKDDPSKFSFQEETTPSTRKSPIKAINGKVLSLRLKGYNGRIADLEATVWSGNLGAYTLDFTALYLWDRWVLYRKPMMRIS